MNGYIITIDGGTTNTRCILWNEQRKMLSDAKRDIGVRCTSVDGNNIRLTKAVKECIDEVLEKAGIPCKSVSCILGSGMITSDLGLCTVPWITAPAGIEELADNIRTVSIPEICPVPFKFIPGIKNGSGPFKLENIGSMDIMRGEEAESIAILNSVSGNREKLLVLPGSHNKFIPVSREGKILGCITSISGELLACITNNTVIAKSVEKSFGSPENYDREMVLAGYEEARKQGLGKACFTGRVLMLFTEHGPKDIANYILGASIADDLLALKNSSAFRISRDTQVIVAGKEPLQSAITDIFRKDGYFQEVCAYENKENIPLSAIGQYLIAEREEVQRTGRG